MLEQQAEEAGRNRPRHEQPAELRIGVVGADATVTETSPHPPEDPHPVLEEEEEQHDRRRQVSGDEEGDEVVVVLVDVPPEELRAG